MLFTVNAESPI